MKGTRITGGYNQTHELCYFPGQEPLPSARTLNLKSHVHRNQIGARLNSDQAPEPGLMWKRSSCLKLL
jgi:hypothetical protein